MYHFKKCFEACFSLRTNFVDQQIIFLILLTRATRYRSIDQLQIFNSDTVLSILTNCSISDFYKQVCWQSFGVQGKDLNPWPFIFHYFRIFDMKYNFVLNIHNCKLLSSNVWRWRFQVVFNCIFASDYLAIYKLEKLKVCNINCSTFHILKRARFKSQGHIF